MNAIAKKIKVRITDKVGAWYHPNKTGQSIKYVPGDTLEIEERFFRSDIMAKVLSPAPKPVPEEIPTTGKEEPPKETGEDQEPEKPVLETIKPEKKKNPRRG